MSHRCKLAVLSAGLVVLGAFLALLWTAPSWGETLKVTQENQSLYPAPDFAGTPIGALPLGAQVTVVQRSGDWIKVNYQGQVGWMHRRALGAAPRIDLPRILTGRPAVRETTQDEAALAGKGFNPEVEAAYRQKNPNLNFALVDQVESYQVNPAQLQAFVQEGGLNP